VSVKIRLKRMGKIRAPYYRIVVADSRTKRDGRAIEEIGKYHPTEEPSYIEVNSERVQYWLGVGAQPTEQVLAILKITGDWQTFKGEPGGEGTLKAPRQRADKKAVFEAAARESLGDTAAAGATTPKGQGRKKAESAPAPATPTAPTAPAGPVAGEQPPADQPVADEQPPADQPVADEQPPADQPAASEQPADAADEGAPGGSETSAQVEHADETAQAEG
jgi:small subunit ribosomal protein S16